MTDPRPQPAPQKSKNPPADEDASPVVAKFPDLKGARSWASSDLARSGLTLSDMDISPEVEPFTGLQQYRIWYPGDDGIYTHDAEVAMWCLRRREGTPKYLGPSGRTGVYLTAPMADLFTGPLWIVEGEKKAVASRKYLAASAVGIRGCWGWVRNEGIMVELVHLAQNGRHVIVVFDGDVQVRQDIRRALGTLCKLLMTMGCTVEVPLLPAGQGSDKVGIDDWIMSYKGKRNVKAAFARLPRMQDLRKLPEAQGWRARRLPLLTIDKGPQNAKYTVPVVCEHNTMILLEDFAGEKGYIDDWHAGPLVLNGEGYRPYNERADEMEMTQQIQIEMGMPWPLQMVRAGIGARMGMNQTNMLAEWVRSQKWDGKSRVEKMFVTYWGALDNPYTRSAAIAFMVGWVNRILTPGSQMDYMIIFEGPQGIYKSKALEVLAGEICGRRMARSTLFHISMRDLINMASSCSMLIMEELAALSMHDLDQLKDFITNREDTWDKKYMAHAVSKLRGFVLAGTTNAKQYLIDKTGNRRFVPIECNGMIDIDGLERDRPQLFAEALVMLEKYQKAGTSWWLIDGHDKQTGMRMLERGYENSLASAMESSDLPKLTSGEHFLTMRYVCQIMGVSVDDTGRLGGKLGKELSQAMAAMGWGVRQIRSSQIDLKSFGKRSPGAFFIGGMIPQNCKVWLKGGTTTLGQIKLKNRTKTLDVL